MNSEIPPPDTRVIDFLAWLEVNKKKLAIATAALIAAGFTLAVVRYQKEQKEIKAGGALAEVRIPMGAPTNTPPPGSADFLKIASEYSGTAAANRAQLMAASALFAEGKYSESHEAFRKYLSENGASPFAPIAALGVASSLEAQKKMDEALQQYQTVATAYSKSSVATDAKLGQARIYELKKQPEQALRIYNELSPSIGLAGMGSRPEVSLKREQLLKAHPELDTNRAPAVIQGPLITPATNVPALNPPAVTNTPAAAPTNAAPPTGTPPPSNPETKTTTPGAPAGETKVNPPPQGNP